MFLSPNPRSKYRISQVFFGSVDFPHFRPFSSCLPFITWTMGTEKHSLKATQERPTKCEDSVSTTYLKATRLGDSRCLLPNHTSCFKPTTQTSTKSYGYPPETNIFAPANGCFEDYCILFFLGARLIFVGFCDWLVSGKCVTPFFGFRPWRKIEFRGHAVLQELVFEDGRPRVELDLRGVKKKWIGFLEPGHLGLWRPGKKDGFCKESHEKHLFECWTLCLVSQNKS